MFPVTGTGSSSGASPEVAARNSAAINADLVRQLVEAPDELRQTFRTFGYDGVVRWSNRFMDLCDTVIRVHWLGLMTDETRRHAIDCCDRCLDLKIPVDVITSEAGRVKHALD